MKALGFDLEILSALPNWLIPYGYSIDDELGIPCLPSRSEICCILWPKCNPYHRAYTSFLEGLE